MPELICLVGLQGSGKSTFAKGLATCGDYEIVSSDAIRKEFNNEIANDKVFKLYYERARQLLSEGRSVVLDATNITIKSRKQIFENLKGIECTKICLIFNTPIETCAKRIANRNKTGDQAEVPLEVLYKYEKSFEMPFYEEGWDNIQIAHEEDFNAQALDALVGIMDKFDQQNAHHKFSLGEHCRRLEEFLKATAPIPNGVGILHDVGKLFTKTFDADGQAHYYQHHNVGAYYVLTHPYLTSSLTRLNVLFYINYHMVPFNLKTEKSIEKWKKIFGPTKFQMLQIINEGDKKASGTQ